VDGAPEIIVGLRQREDGRWVVLSQSGESAPCNDLELPDVIRRVMQEHGKVGVASRVMPKTEQQLREAGDFLVGVFRDQMSERYGEQAVSAAETVGRHALSKAKTFLDNGPKGASGKARLLQRRKALRGG
jgi:hypothetical protein